VPRVAARCIEEALEAEVAKLLEREWYERRKCRKRRRTRARCKQCGSQDSQDFRRDGHYRRYWDTAWGQLRINVPQVKCTCGGKDTLS